MKIRYLKRALRDLERLELYIRMESPRGAARIGARLRKRIDDLAQFPEQGEMSAKAGARRLVVTQTPYIVIYRVMGEQVHIITIRHVSRKLR